MNTLLSFTRAGKLIQQHVRWRRGFNQGEVCEGALKPVWKRSHSVAAKYTLLTFGHGTNVRTIASGPSSIVLLLMLQRVLLSHTRVTTQLV